MAAATDLQGLAYDIKGTGAPVVFLHGLTFDRRTWRPVIDRLDGSVTSIASPPAPAALSGGTMRRGQAGRVYRGPPVWPGGQLQEES